MNLDKQTYNKKIILGKGICKKCGGDTCVKKRLEPSPKQLRKNYYFSKSETCNKCGAVWLKEEDKVYTNKSIESKQQASNEILLSMIKKLKEDNLKLKAELDKYLVN